GAGRLSAGELYRIAARSTLPDPDADLGDGNVSDGFCHRHLLSILGPRQGWKAAVVDRKGLGREHRAAGFDGGTGAWRAVGLQLLHAGVGTVGSRFLPGLP